VPVDCRDDTMKYREKFLDLVVAAKSPEEIEKIFDYFKKKGIEIDEDYLRTALNKFFAFPPSDKK
jgi:hypothetical protein